MKVWNWGLGEWDVITEENFDEKCIGAIRLTELAVVSSFFFQTENFLNVLNHLGKVFKEK